MRLTMGLAVMYNANAYWEISGLEKYSSGRRGPPAKGVGRIKPARGFKSLFLRSGLLL